MVGLKGERRRCRGYERSGEERRREERRGLYVDLDVDVVCAVQERH